MLDKTSAIVREGIHSSKAHTSSKVPLMKNLIVVISFVCPIRWIRANACSSTVGFLYHMFSGNLVKCWSELKPVWLHKVCARCNSQRQSGYHESDLSQQKNVFEPTPLPHRIESRASPGRMNLFWICPLKLVCLSGTSRRQIELLLPKRGQEPIVSDPKSISNMKRQR